MAKIFMFIDLALGAIAWGFNARVKNQIIRALLWLLFVESILFALLNLSIYLWAS